MVAWRARRFRGTSSVTATVAPSTARCPTGVASACARSPVAAACRLAIAAWIGSMRTVATRAQCCTRIGPVTWPCVLKIVSCRCFRIGPRAVCRAGVASSHDRAVSRCRVSMAARPVACSRRCAIAPMGRARCIVYTSGWTGPHARTRAERWEHSGVPSACSRPLTTAATPVLPNRNAHAMRTRALPIVPFLPGLRGPRALCRAEAARRRVRGRCCRHRPTAAWRAAP